LQIYQELVKRTREALHPFRNVSWVYSPNNDESFRSVKEWMDRPEWLMQPQSEGDLGDRLLDGFGNALATNGGAIAIGTDCPWINSNDIQAAIQTLESGGTDQLVLGPATDGGYWLIGMNRLHPELFQQIPWSADQTLEVTVKRARELGLKMDFLRELSDVDNENDWNKWQVFDTQNPCPNL
jgi:rSAM/selenodomain-associated transferase 1